MATSVRIGPNVFLDTMGYLDTMALIWQEGNKDDKRNSLLMSQFAEFEFGS